jgi:hypothetical protein
MLAQCIEAVTKAAGRALSKAEIDGIEERMLSSMQTLARKDPAAWRSMSKDQRYVEAAKLARSRYGEDVMAAQARTIRDMQTRTNQIRLTDSFKPGERLAALRQRLTFGNKYTGDISLDQKVKAVHNDFTRELDGGAMKGKFWGLVQDPNEQRTIIKAIFGEATGKPEIDKVGQQVRDVLERARVTANDAGVQIHHLDNWNLPQPWAWEKIGEKPDQFVKDMLAEIDHNSYVRKDGTPMTAEEIRKTVEASAETLGTNGANKRAEATSPGYGGSVGSTRNAPRQLHFKNADGYIRMMEKYGASNNVMSMLDQHLRGMARDIATARTFGRDADRFVPQLIDRAFAADAQSGKTEKQLKKLDRLKKRTTAEYNAMRSPGHPGALPLWSQVSNTIRGVVGSTLLGGSTLAAIPDMGMALSYGHEIGLTRRALLGNMAEGVKPTKENLEFVRRLGITAQTLQDGTHRFGSGELSNQFTRFLNHGVHVLSLLRMWDRSMTHGVSASLMDVLGGHVAKHDFADLQPSEQKYLADRGVTADHYATWRQAELETGPNDNHTMLTPDSIYAIPDEKLRPIAQARMGDKAKPAQVDEDIRRLRSEAAQHLLALTLSESQIGARGGAGNTVRDNVALHVTPDNAGTVMGQMARWLLFLKQTPLGIFRTHMIDVPGGMGDWKSAWAYRARFMAYSASLGALALTAKKLALGQDPDDLLTTDGLKKVALASGGFGMYGDFIFGDNGDHQNNAFVKVLGPGATFLSDAYDMAHNTSSEVMGEGKNYGAKALQFARNYAMPFTRLWYAKAAFNHMVYEQQMEKLNPGYNARVRARMARKNQNAWWQSGEMAPDRAPDLGAAIGQPAQP